MPQWIGSAVTVASVLVALAALIVSIRASRLVARKREFEFPSERIDQEADKREKEVAKFDAKTRAFIERIDREAARREAETRAFIEQIDRKAAKRGALRARDRQA